MRYNSNFGNVIWTNHVLERLVQRGLPQRMAYEAFQYPEESKEGKELGTIEYRRRFDGHLVTVVAKRSERGAWVILSCWVDPPFPGSVDIQRRTFEKSYKRASILGRLWLLFKKEVLKW